MLAMTLRQRVGGVLAIAGAGLALVVAAQAPADPADPVVPPPPPVTTTVAPAPITDPADAPPAPITPQHPPEIQNPTYGSGKYGGGVFGTLRDLMDQARNPYFLPDQLGPAGAVATPPPGAGPAPALPPGYVSTNAPGSETPSTGGASGPAAGRPALPPGYYSIDGPPPPGYQYAPSPLAPGLPAAPVTTPVPVP